MQRERGGAWPLICRCNPAAPSTAKTWNLTLEEPALTTRMVSMAITRQLLERSSGVHRPGGKRRRRMPYATVPNPRATSARPGRARQARCRREGRLVG